jgi:hypothetical protein
MSDTLKVEPFVAIPASTSVAEALTRLTGVSFALIGNTSNPQGLVQAAHLQAVADEGIRPLSEVLEHLPPLVVITGETVALLNTEGLKRIALLLHRKKIPGLVVYHNQQAIGVISRKTIATALSPTAIFSTDHERGDLYGDTVTRARCYICHMCKEEGQAQYIFSPDQGQDAMNCPFDPLHGRMSPYEE